jgi:hypothetical protein
MPGRPVTDLVAWPALALEGSLIAPAMLALVAREKAESQRPEDYGLRKGLTLRDEISLAFRAGQAHWRDFARTPDPGPQATARFAERLLREAFGFDDLSPGVAPLVLGAAGGRVPVVVVPPSDALDRRSPVLSSDRPRSAALALQDHLNANEDALWGLAINGAVLRLVRDNGSLTRPAYLDADLARIFGDEDVASFALLWLLVHRSRFGRAGPPADCPLERWRETGAREGTSARDRLAGQVGEALAILGTGFLSADHELRTRVWAADDARVGFFNELLRLVYRLIFLMVAEDRDLLHPPGSDLPARQLYETGYSLTRLRALARRRSAWDRHHDRYEGLKVVFRALARGEPRLALPALGGLFDPAAMPMLAAATLPNRALMEAIWRLAYLREGTAMAPVNWRAMETEELGSVYESLLELQPQPGEDGRALIFAADAAEQRGNQRKTTGSYYTPDSLVQALLDSALDPVLDRAEGAEDPETALLDLNVIDPACGSGHFLISAARRIAERLARHRAAGLPSGEDRRHALRDVVRSCIHGVDRNPMAVELTKVALWIETVEPGLPLGFLDANIRCGDALLGVFDRKVLLDGIPDAAYKPLTGDDKDTANYYRRENRAAREGQGTLGLDGDLSTLPTARPFSRAHADLRAMPEDDLEEIAAKAARHRSLREARDFQLAELACNLYVAAFLLPKTGGPPASRGARRVPTTEDVWQTLRGELPYGPLLAAVEAARDSRAFHWPLEFPAVMAKGGFDVVLGNPPWERIKLQEKEFFAARAPDIAAAPNAATRSRMIAALARAELGTPRRALFQAFETSKQQSEASSAFVRLPGDEGGRFPLTGVGDVNTYALFAELFSRLASSSGRAGVILPTGIATDATTAPFFASLIDSKRLARLIDFENRDRIFPSVYFRVKFCLLTIGRGEEAAGFAFFLTDPAQLANPERNFTLTPEAIATINPNTRTAPIFRSRADAELTAKIYARVPVLIDETKGRVGNPWGVTFMAMFHMSNDSGLFRTAAQLAEAGYIRDGADWVAEGARPRQSAMALAGGRDVLHLDLQGGGPRDPSCYVPLYEAKMIFQYTHRYGDFAKAKVREEADYREIPSPTLEELRDPSFEVTPRYWVTETDVDARLATKGWRRGWLMGWRDVTNATNERTVIATAFPRAGVNHKMPLVFVEGSVERAVALLANALSLAFDFVARQKVGGTSLTYFYLKQFPVLAPDLYTDARLAFITPRVLELTYTSHAMVPFARDLRYDGPPFAWDEDRRAHLRAELDAFYARVYGLDRNELRYILDPADVKGPDYPSETFRVLKTNEIRRYGDYRTARLVLAAWDRFEANGTFAGLGL